MEPVFKCCYNCEYSVTTRQLRVCVHGLEDGNYDATKERFCARFTPSRHLKSYYRPERWK